MRPFKLSLEQIQSAIGACRKEGNFGGDITGVASLDHAGKSDLSFLGNRHYEAMVKDSSAGVLLLPEDFAYTPRPDQMAFFVKNPSLAFALVCERIEAILRIPPTPGIHPTAFVDREAWVSSEACVGPLCVVEAGATIQKGVVLGAQCYIGPNVVIGTDTILKPGVRVQIDCTVGERCILHSGVVLGSDGFGYEFVNGAHRKVPQIGIVSVGDDVEIGANTAIDRARFGVTTIGAGTKIDNLVQIGHNVKIGKGCILVAQVGIAGSTTLEDYVVVGGQVGIAGHLTVGTATQIGAQSGINSSVGPHLILAGTPAMEMQQNYRLEVLRRKLPELFKRVEKIERHFEK